MFRKSDVDEVLASLKANGGLDDAPEARLVPRRPRKGPHVHHAHEGRAAAEECVSRGHAASLSEPATAPRGADIHPSSGFDGAKCTRRPIRPVHPSSDPHFRADGNRP